MGRQQKRLWYDPKEGKKKKRKISFLDSTLLNVEKVVVVVVGRDTHSDKSERRPQQKLKIKIGGGGQASDGCAARERETSRAL